MQKDLHIVVHQPDFALDELRRLRDSGWDNGELWIERESTKVCALVSAGRGFLMFLREVGDAGFSSRNREEESTAMHAFRLSNGQVDEYPLAWTYPVEDVLRALEAFVASGRMLSHIAWHNDSGDGSQSPTEPPA